MFGIPNFLRALTRPTAVVIPKTTAVVASSPAPARAEQLTIDLPLLAAQCAVTEAETMPVSIYTLFTPTGGFRYHALFRYNRVVGKNLAQRKGVFAVIKNCSQLDFMALPFARRKLFFAFLKQERARYDGTALRQRDTVAGKAGQPLPKLTFPTPQDAAAYRQLLQDAHRTICQHVFGNR